MERTFDGVILKAKLEEFIIESKRNIDSKIEKINSFLQIMKEENNLILNRSNIYFLIYFFYC